ncbi:MAG: ATP-dependent nuclease [Aeromicrobium sp.]
MPIEYLTVQGLRGFAVEQRIDFAQPDGSRSGSGLTVLVGPNSGGKSTILEALRAPAQHRPVMFAQGQRNANSGDSVHISWRQDGTDGSLQSVRDGSSETDKNGAIVRLVHIPSRRSFNPYFGDGVHSRRDLEGGFGIPAFRGQQLEGFTGRMLSMERGGHQQAFNDLVGEILGHQFDWSIDRQDTGQYFIKIRTATASMHSSDGLGEGTLSAMVITDVLYDSQPGDVIVIDEPELSLHPVHQRRMSSVLSRYAIDRQIIIATHSPYFVDWSDLDNGAVIARVHLGDGSSKISTANRPTVDKLAASARDLNNPHTLGIQASEVFFLDDDVIVVEGQEDVVIYRSLASQLGIGLDAEFFGWGAGGAEKMVHIVKLLQSLGFERVVGILDADKVNRQTELQTAFPSYKFLAIPTDDVRDKEAREITAKSGLTTKGGVLKPEHEADVRQLFDAVNSYVGATRTPAN